MKTDNAGSAPGMAAASTSAQKTEPTESEYLDQEAKKARQAMAAAIEDLTSNLIHGVDPRLWTKQYPWAAIGSAAVIGFAAAYGLIPSQQEQAIKKLREIERALAAGPPGGASCPDGVDADDAAHLHSSLREARHSRKRSVFQRFLKHLVAAAGPAVMKAITASVSQAVQQARRQASVPSEYDAAPGVPGHTPPADSPDRSAQ